MNRRESFEIFPWIIVGTAFSSNLFVSCKTDNYSAEFFDSAGLKTIGHIADTILPQTVDSPAPTSIYLHHFLDKYISQCLSLDLQSEIKSGLEGFSKDIRANHNKVFDDLDSEEKESYLENALSSNSKENKFIHHLKQLILFAYFTSQEGATKALSYIQTPGRYEGDIPYESGQKSWSL